MNNIVVKTLWVTAIVIMLLIAILLVVTFSNLDDSRSIVILSFVRILFDYPLVIPACLIFLPSLLWKQSMFLAYLSILGLVLITPFIQVIYQLYSGYSNAGFGEALGMAIVLILWSSYIVGMTIRAIFHPAKKNPTGNTISEFSFKTSDIVARNSRDKNSQKSIKQNL